METEIKAVRELLHVITTDASEREAGRRALLLCFILNPEAIGSQKQLAARLGVSEARTSQLLNEFRQKFTVKASGN